VKQTPDLLPLDAAVQYKLMAKPDTTWPLASIRGHGIWFDSKQPGK